VKRLPFIVLLAAPLLSAGCTQYSKVRQISGTIPLAVTARQKSLAIAQEKLADRPLEQLGGYLDAADAARRALATDPTDPLLQSDYNFAVARVVDAMISARVAPWDEAVTIPSPDSRPWSLRVISPFRQREYHPSHFTYRPADRYQFFGSAVGDRVTKAGLGAPLVVAGRELDYVAIDRFAQGNQIFYGLTALLKFNGRRAELQLVDPLDRESVSLDGRTYPLAGDYQAPLELALAELHVRERELGGFLRPQKVSDKARLARLQPYNPRKIPVLFIHGLTNSPATWAPVLEFLRTDPSIRQNFQFWFYAYPSGLPYNFAAAKLREQIAGIRRRHPDAKEIIVVGHSMGGMIARLLVTDSGDKLWNTYFAKPPGEVPLSDKARPIVTGSLIFNATPGIARAIFVSASHRGSHRARGFWANFGTSVIGSPLDDEGMFAEVRPYLRPEALERSRGHLPNSLQLLDPDNLFVSAVAELPIHQGIPYHSIIGDRGRGGYLDRTEPVSNDGLVPYWSSHIEGATSERVIPAGHWTHLHPLAMAEIKRILLEHIGL
jgi:pimeloyl-ACP methyl ester carboxylesterase